MEDNKIKALTEELNVKPDATRAKRLFYNIYEYLLYNDTQFFLNILDYRMNLDPLDKPNEDYFVFRYMIRLMKKKYFNKLSGFIGIGNMLVA